MCANRLPAVLVTSVVWLLAAPPILRSLTCTLILVGAGATARAQQASSTTSEEPVEAPLADALSGAGVSRSSWIPLGPSTLGGTVTSIAIDPTNPSRIFAGSDGGGIWRTTDGGVSWTPVDDYMASLVVTSILFRPRDPGTLYAGTGSWPSYRGAGILRSTDGGDTWTPLPATTTPEFSYVNALAIAADGGVLLAATESGLFRSPDGGASWSLVLAKGTGDVKFLPGNDMRAVAFQKYIGSETYYSTDGGASWRATAVPWTKVSWGPFVSAVSPASPGIVYVAVGYAHVFGFKAKALWKSTDGGQTYSSKAVESTGEVFEPGLAIWVDPTDANTVVLGGHNLWRSQDGGTSWTRVSDGTLAPQSAHHAHHAIVNDPGYDGVSNRRVYFGTEGGLYETDDIRTVTSTPSGGFTALNNRLAITHFTGGAGHAGSGTIIGGTTYGALRYAASGGAMTWDRIVDSSTGPTAIDLTDPNYVYTNRIIKYGYLGPPPLIQILRSADGGATWDPISAGEGACCTPSPFVLDPNNSNTLLAGGRALVRTNDIKTPVTSTTGPTWTAIAPSSYDAAITAIGIAAGDSNTIWYARQNGDVFATTNGTVATPTWMKVDTNAPGLPDRAVTRITIDPRDSAVVYVAFDGYNDDALWKTTDAGATWTDLTGSGATGLPDVPVRSLAIHPKNSSLIYAGTDTGVFTSTDGGGTWSTQSDGPAHVSVTDLFWMHTDLVAVTNGRGMFRTRTTDVLMALDDPVHGRTITQPFIVRGWAFDRTAASGTGVDAIHVWAHPHSGAAPIFLGAAPRVLRPDVGTVFGDRFSASGFELEVRGLAPGTYAIVAYARSTISETFAAARAATITIAPPVSNPLASIDTPNEGATVGPSFFFAGWALDLGAPTGTGVDAIHVYAFPDGGGAPTFLGVGAYGGLRGDVGAAFGMQFTNSGYFLTVSGLAPGTYQVVVYFRSTITGVFASRARRITVRTPGDPHMAVDTPANGSTPTRPFLLGGWAIDRDAPSGTGVDMLHVWAYPAGGGPPMFVGVPAYGGTRGDVGAIFGSRFTNSGYNLIVSTLPPGQYQLVVFARSTVTGTFNQARVVSVIVGGP